MAKYNWNSLKNSFIHGDYKNLKDFSKAKKIPYKTLIERARGWLEEKQLKDREKTEQIGQSFDKLAEGTQDGGRVGQRKHFNGEKVK